MEAAKKQAQAAAASKPKKILTAKERKALAAKGGSKAKKKAKKKLSGGANDLAGALNKTIAALSKEWRPVYNAPGGRVLRALSAVFICWSALGYSFTFYAYSHRLAVGMSQPSIMYEAKLRDGSKIMVDDYREAYWWLRDNTPTNARVMAWWDYGYQIAGIAERTTIADGNTWNHEHIATLGRCMASEEQEAHKMVKVRRSFLCLLISFSFLFFYSSLLCFSFSRSTSLTTYSSGRAAEATTSPSRRTWRASVTACTTTFAPATRRAPSSASRAGGSRRR